MDDAVFKEEQINLTVTTDFLSMEIEKEMGVLSKKRDDLKELNKYMWTNNINNNLDPDMVKDTAQVLAIYRQAAGSAGVTAGIVVKYEKLLDAPYFGRFDIVEDGCAAADKIYVGFHNLMDLTGGKVYVYDWRSPIAGVYYRYGLGKCLYDSPDGQVLGEVLLKRQLKIEKGKLKYYVDSGLVIRDEILLETLGQNATQKMKTIVETIQREQDKIIRDLTHDALIVSGVAGSGKTSIALHRIAYLLYETKITKLTHKNILVLSPNDVFSDYIDEVLPNLGEEPVKQTTLDEIYTKAVEQAARHIKVQHRHKHLEGLMGPDGQKRMRSYELKTSLAFAKLLDSYAVLYERRLHEFYDVFVNGKTVFTRKELKDFFLDNKAKLPAAQRLKRIEARVIKAVKPMFEAKRPKLKEIVFTSEKRAFEEEKYIEKYISKLQKRFLTTLRRQLSINPLKIYYRLISDKNLFDRLAKGVDLPAGAFGAFKKTKKCIQSGILPYEDAAAVLYLSERLCGSRDYAGVRHVIIDEAQDYSPMSFITIKRIFPDAKYTVLGDAGQTIGKKAEPDFFAKAAELLACPNTAVLSLDKSYRSSLEIHDFCEKILGREDSEAFCRNGEKPAVFVAEQNEIIKKMDSDIADYIKDGRHSIAVLAKTMKSAREVFETLETKNKRLLDTKNAKLSDGVNVLPCYMAKGLEFDFVLVYGADDENYSTETDRRLLYVACTRALHKLSLYAEGSLSKFVPKNS